MYARAEGMLNGIMIYWKEVPEAAVYRIRLFIQDRHRKWDENVRKEIEDKGEFIEIAVVEEPRNIRYHSFVGLATIDKRCIRSGSIGISSTTGRDYFVSVEAEDRSGAVVDQSEKILVNLDYFVGENAEIMHL